MKSKAFISNLVQFYNAISFYTKSFSNKKMKLIIVIKIPVKSNKNRTKRTKMCKLVIW